MKNMTNMAENINQVDIQRLVFILTPKQQTIAYMCRSLQL